MTIQTTIAPDGSRLVTMTADEYENLIDARDHALAMCAVRDGTMPLIPAEAMDAYLEAPTPLAFWRKHRDLTQAELAEAAGISQAYVAQIERGTRQAVDVGIVA